MPKVVEVAGIIMVEPVLVAVMPVIRVVPLKFLAVRFMRRAVAHGMSVVQVSVAVINATVALSRSMVAKWKQSVV